MIINQHKSAFTSLIPDVVLTVREGVLEQVKAYKYLGFPQTSMIIDWKAYFQACVNKGRKFLNSLRVSANHWPIWAKLAIYRAFLRPLLNMELL